MPLPPDLMGLMDLVFWGVLLFIVVIIGVVLADKFLSWFREGGTTRRSELGSAETEVFEELLKEIKALRKEISDLRDALKE